MRATRTFNSFQMVCKVSPHFYSEFDTVKMQSSIVVLLTVSFCCRSTLCETMSITRRPTVEQMKKESMNKIVRNNTIGINNPWMNFLWPRYELPNEEKLQSLEETKTETTKRKSRILGSLAFLAGLGVGGLAGAASTSLKSYTKLPEASLTLNLGPSRLSPYMGSIYEPYTYPAHRYIYPPFGLYPLFDPIRLQSALGSWHTGINQQNQLTGGMVNLDDDHRPEDFSDNDKYVVEDKRVENENIAATDNKKSNDRVELRLGTDRNAEDKIRRNILACGTQKKTVHPDSQREEILEQEDLQVDKDDSVAVLNRQAQTADLHAGNTTTSEPGQHHHHHHHHHNEKNQSMTTTQNSTSVNNQTTMTPPSTYPSPTYPSFFGYYGGRPQQIDHIDLTTENSVFQSDDYPPVKYNLPLDVPANFLPEEKYNYYSNPPGNPYFSNQYVVPPQEQVPEYYNSDYYRLNSPENLPLHTNGFRPVL